MGAQLHPCPSRSCVESVAEAVPTKGLHCSQLRFKTPVWDGFRPMSCCRETMHPTLSIVRL